MMGFFRFLWRKHRVLAVVLGLALAGLGWFGTQFVREAIYFAKPENQRQPLAMWMSPRYVGRSWDLPRDTIIRIMELEPDNRQKTLYDVTEHLGISLEALEVRVRAARAELDARQAMEYGHD